MNKQQKAEYSRKVSNLLEQNGFFKVISMWWKEDCDLVGAKVGDYHVGVQPLTSDWIGKKQNSKVNKQLSEMFNNLKNLLIEAGFAENVSFKSCHTSVGSCNAGLLITPILN
jgi:hypothetical protein